MRLYHHPFSSNARRAVMTALELGLPVDLAVVDLAKGEQRGEAFRALNPNGKVPVLEDDGFVLTESHAIMQYLAEKTPGQGLYPSELRARADVNRWLFWNAHHFQPAVSVFNWENKVKPLLGLGPADPKEIERGERLLADCGRVLDAHLAGRTWISGGRFTLADVAIATTLMTIEVAKVPVAPYANVLAWLARVEQRDSWKRTSL